MESPFRMACTNLEQGHVGPTPGAVDGEKTQPGCGQAVEMGVGVGHQLSRLLARRIERDGMIRPIGRLERHLSVQPVDRAGGGIDQVLHPGLATPLQHGEVAGEVAVGIGEGLSRE